ncbi:MAG: molybdopterin molybdotransferase MoeA [Propioniciclava sp.]|uniref:molybdopterin molybdotransferase MoeA n=1 Tax=Propioniciclava sp. TaxID=2038686 RepID=UPI0039E38FAF
MITVEQYLERVLALATPLPAQECPVASGFGRVLDEDLVARLAVPPFDNSAMDGFAVRSADTSAGADTRFAQADPATERRVGSADTSVRADTRLAHVDSATERRVGSADSSVGDDSPAGLVMLRVVGDIPAGASSAPKVGPGEAARIMTGAPMPIGADTVVPVEDTDQPLGDAPLPGFVQVPAVAPGRNVRGAGEDVRVGEVVLRRGQIWTPAAAGAAASIGYATVRLRRRPRVAVLATGSELVAPGEPLGFGQIPDSNSILLAGLIEGFGGEVVVSRAVGDDPGEFRDALADASGADLIVTSGGVSVGAFEVVRQVVEGEIEFVRVAMQPGKPQACGRLGEQALLALPGNPVSVFVSAWVFLRPLLAAFQGVDAPGSRAASRSRRDGRPRPGAGSTCRW